jgi:hypothetical protein
MAQAPFEKPTPERLRHAIGDDGEPMIAEIEIGDRNTNWRAFRLNDAPLGRLRFRKKPLVTRDQFNAGELFHGLVYHAGLMPSGTLDMTRDIVDGGGYAHMPDRLVAAKARYEIILKRMDPNLHHITTAIVINETPIAEYAERLRHRQRRDRHTVAVDRLCMGLDWLARHFGIAGKPQGIRTSMRERSRIPPKNPS